METATDVAAPAAETQWIGQDKIDIPDYAREHDPDQLKNLISSMSSSRGLLQNIVVAPKGDRFEVIAGAGRILAARELKWEKIRAEVRPGLSELEKALITIEENDDREPTTPIDKALSYKRAIDASKRTSEELDQRALAAKLGVTEATMSRYLALADLKEELRKNLNRFKFLGLMHLNHILRLPTPEMQLKMAEDANQGEWTVSQVKAKVDAVVGPSIRKSLKAEKAAAPSAPLPTFNGGGQSFTFAQKGNKFTMETEPPSMDMLDVFMQNTRCAIIDYLAAQPQKEA